ncbi:hypothetical protein C8Q70DRAFT_219731 [Cubamyces menziesii]|nr:hypothetical protein C8Q70DRAFT_219731 [Cubamyces menziesii]
MLPMYGYSSHWGPGPAAWKAGIDVTTCFNVFQKIGPFVLPALREMHDLRTVWIKAAFLDEDTLLHLGTLPSLTTFAIENGWTSVGYPDRTKSPVKVFAPLKHLLVSIAHAQCPAFLAYITPDLLESITIHWEYLYSDPDSSGDTLQSCLQELAHIPAPRHVAVILDKFMEQQIVDYADSTVRLRGLAGSSFYLQRILQMSHIVTLEIGIDVAFQIDNKFLHHVARRLPMLDTLALVPLLKAKYSMDWSDEGDEEDDEEEDDEDAEDDEEDDDDFYYRSSPPLPTLDGLFDFAERCTRLRTLKIAVEGTFSTAWERDSTRGTNCVRTIELWASALDGKISDDVFVDFLVRAFPSMDDLRVLVPTNPTRSAEGPDSVNSSDARCRWDAVLRDVHRRHDI